MPTEDAASDDQNHPRPDLKIDRTSLFLRIDANGRIAGLGAAHDDSAAGIDIVAQIARDLRAGAVRNIERLYWRMIADGKLPSRGWKIEERVEFNGDTVTHRCWAVPPAGSRAAGGDGESGK